jgi:adenylosuccinate lyase
MSVLADRYASKEMRVLWSRDLKIKAERDLWISVLESQRNLGLEVTQSVIDDYKCVKDIVDLESIDAREVKNKHDVKSRIDEFNYLAGHQKIHIGMTSRDLTENIELFQIRSALELVSLKSLALMKHLAVFCEKYVEMPFVARTHNVPAQLTTLGRRFASHLEELMFSFNHLKELQARLPLRGIKGPIGTAQDLSEIFGENFQAIEMNIAATLGFQRILKAPSQVYPRSMDYEIVTTLAQIASSPSNIATNVRIMSGYGLVSEGFGLDQVGSSAMPHKINARLSERVTGLSSILRGNVVMIQEMIGNQWNEGDVSCSVIRRVALPDAFFAIDAILDTVMRIIRELTINDKAIDREVKENLPFLLTTKLLALAVEKGIGREDAHSLLKKYSMAALENIQEHGINNLFELVLADDRLGLSRTSLDSLGDPKLMISSAIKQTRTVSEEALLYLRSNPDSDAYIPSESL